MFDIKVGVPFLSQLHAEAERLIVRMAEDRLIVKGYEYVSVPSLLKKETFDRQAHITWNQVTRIENYRSDEIGLSGSAEQGILEMYTNSFMLKPLKLFATNQCFRDEPLLEGLKSVREFKKVEQFSFCKPEDSSSVFEEFLANHTQLMSDLGLKYRWMDQTNLDRGYHKKKIDVEVLTSSFGWLETCSCAWFGTEQADRFNIAGPANNTVSCTMAALPRLLIPMIEIFGNNKMLTQIKKVII